METRGLECEASPRTWRHRRDEGAGIEQLSDAEVVEEALAGSQDAFRELVRRFERPVFSLVVRMVRDRTTAEDLTQEAFVKAFRGLDGYDASRKFSSWLFKIAHNATIDHLRRRELDTVPLEAPAGDDDEAGGGLARVLADPASRGPDVVAGRGDLATALRQSVRLLRPEYREIVLLRYGEGMAYEEIAEIAELPLGTVKTYIHRARKELMATLSEAGWGPEGLGE
ncbi:MAG TPA: sigma-70 family RNA polymerase sigma factor [Thermoanaerobaculia bacterium]|nr:sigma-70 family RNA polymerase sigma factor [Thermoanaerobaculia bacterium]